MKQKSNLLAACRGYSVRRSSFSKELQSVLVRTDMSEYIHNQDVLSIYLSLGPLELPSRINYYDIEELGETVYIGQRNSCDQRHGTGIFIDSTGVYEGNWCQDLRSGFGRQITGSSEVYEGNWQDDEPTGE